MITTVARSGTQRLHCASKSLKQYHTPQIEVDLTQDLQVESELGEETAVFLSVHVVIILTEAALIHVQRTYCNEAMHVQ